MNLNSFAKARRLLRPALLGLACLASNAATAAITDVNLANYQLTGTYFLPPVSASEASAVTYNWNTDTLFVLGDEGEAIVEVSKTGAQLSVMTLTGFDDTEGLTYIGNGQFVLVEERLRDAYKLTYASGTSVARPTVPNADLGTTVGNIGLEGISFDPRDGSYVTVKEKTAQEVNRNVITFGFPGTATVTPMFTPHLGVLDLSDVQVLATVPSLVGTADASNMLIVSQESAELLEVSSSGVVLSTFGFGTLSDSMEGVTIDSGGIIYMVDENGSAPRLFVLTPTPVPLPAALWLFGSAVLGLAAVGRKKQGG